MSSIRYPFIEYSAERVLGGARGREPGTPLPFRSNVREASGRARSKGSGGSLKPNGTVLVVEDESTLRCVLRRALETVGYEVVEAEDGLQALEIAREARALAFVISDIVLPRLKGPDLRDQVLVGRPHLPFLFISGYPDWQMAEIFHDQRGVGFLGKPFGLQALYESLGNLLGQPLEIV